MLARFLFQVSQMSQQKARYRANGFTFKQFFVAHDRCAMKVGTDGVLLGAWAPPPAGGSVLDIGCGSGLIALMLAQRCTAEVMIEGVELDQDAASQAQENAAASPWAGRIQIEQGDIIHWSQHCNRRYALIVSNPPYFAPGSDCASPQRASARYTGGLTHQVLLECAQRLIEPDGLFCVILPLEAGNNLVALAEQQGWALRRRTDIADKPSRPQNRVMVALSLQPGERQHDSMTIRAEEGHYSRTHCELTRDFYLHR